MQHTTCVDAPVRFARASHQRARFFAPIAVLTLALIGLVTVGCGGPRVAVVDYKIESSRGGYTLHSLTVENQSENHRVRYIRVTVLDERTGYNTVVRSDGSTSVYKDTDYTRVADVDCEGIELEPGQRDTYQVNPPLHFGANKPRFTVSDYQAEEIPEVK